MLLITISNDESTLRGSQCSCGFEQLWVFAEGVFFNRDRIDLTLFGQCAHTSNEMPVARA